MFKKMLSASVVVVIAMASGVAFAQEPPAAPDPQMPATPSMDQKGGDAAMPAGSSKPMMHKGMMHKGMKHKHMMHKHMMKKHMMKKHMSKKMMMEKKAM